MENNEIDPDAQDPNLPDEGNNEVGDQEEVKKQAEGFQKRIDELTAKNHAAERQVAEANERLLNNLAANANRPVVDAGPDPYADLDPTVRKMVTETVGAVTRKFEAQISAVRADHVNELLSRDAEEAAKPYGAEIQKEAKRWVKDMRAKGIPMNGQDAADYALGIAIRTGQYKPQAVQQGNSAPATIGSVRSTVINPAAQKPLPSNFDDLSPDEQIAHLSKRGAGDHPI